ncbi:hypothetical protein DMJ13_27510 [halophilic archaeon]|nr:hypothetical protein DMJ13_27510 [halophilic archaeon]
MVLVSLLKQLKGKKKKFIFQMDGRFLLLKSQQRRTQELVFDLKRLNGKFRRIPRTSIQQVIIRLQQMSINGLPIRGMNSSTVIIHRCRSILLFLKPH